MNSYSKEFRREVLAAGDAGGGTGVVALRFDVSESWVSAHQARASGARQVGSQEHP
jgi:transposase-like protein